MFPSGSLRSWLFVLSLVVCAVAPPALAITSATSGNWNAGATWVGGVVPTASDPVVIADGHTVTVTTTADAAASVTINAAISSGTFLVISPGAKLSVSGTVTINDGGFVNTTLDVGNGSLTCGDLNIAGGVNGGLSTLRIGSGTAQVANLLVTSSTVNSRIEFTAPGKLSISGNMASGATLTNYAPAPGSTVEYNGAAAQSVGTYSYNNLAVANTSAAAVTANGVIGVSGQLALSSGSLVIANALNTGASSKLVMTGTAALKIGDNSATFAVAMPNFAGGYSLAAGTTIEYGAAFSQTVAWYVPYQNLYLRNGGGLAISKTLSGATTVAGNLTVDQQATGSITLNTNNFAITVDGSVFGDGALDMTAGGTLRIVNGTFSNTIAFTPGTTGTVEYAGSGQSVRATTYMNLVIDGGNVILAGSTTATNVTINSGKFLTLSGNSLAIGGNLTVNGTISGVTGVVQMTGFGGLMTGTGAIYPAVTANSSTISGALLFGGNFTIGTSSTITNTGTTDIDLNLDGPFGATWVNDAGSTLNIGGDAMVSGATLDAFAATNTVTYDGAGAQTIAAGSYDNLVLTGSGVKTMQPGVSTTTDFSVTGTAAALTLDDLVIGGNVLIAATASLDGNGFFHQVAGGWVSNNKYVSNGSIVSFNGASGTQTIDATTFDDVEFLNAAPKVLAGAIVANGNFSIVSATVSGGTGLTHNVRGNWVNSGSFVAQTSTVVFDGASLQTVDVSPFYNVTVNGAGITLSGNSSVSNNLLISSGDIDVAATALTLNNLTIDAAGSLTPSNGVITISGNIVTNGAIGGANGTITINGTAIQTWSGAAQSIFDLTINKSAGTLNPSVTLTINGTLTMTNGSIVAPSPAAIVIPSGLLSHTAGHINGRLTMTHTAAGAKLYPFGTTLGDSFVQVTAPAAGTVDMEIFEAPHPSNTGGNAEVLQTYWKIYTGALASLDLNFTWPLAAVNGTESAYVLGFFDGSSWALPGGTVTAATHNASIAGVTTYAGDWTVGAPASLGAATLLEITSDGNADAGVGETFTITARDANNNVATSYSGDHTIVFTGATTSPDGTVPTATDKNAVDVAFGSNTVVTFTNGIATTTMKLYTAELASIDLDEFGGPVSAGTADTLVAAGAASAIAFSDINGGNPLYANGPFSVSVSSTDAYGNVVNVPSDTAVTLSLINCISCNGALSGTTTGTITNGSNVVTISGIVYPAAESNVVLTADGGTLGTTDSSGLTFAAQTAGFVVTTTADSGPGSLRDALTRNNNGECAAPCAVTFNIGAGLQTIAPLSPLPQIGQPIFLDATSQPGYSGTPLIYLDGVNAGAGAHALQIEASGSTIKGFVIGRFGGIGVRIGTDSNVVQNCWIGVAPGGATAAANGAGIAVFGSSNSIGGTLPAERNVVSGNSGRGITIGLSTNNNVVSGNYIGTDVTGAIAIGNDIGVAIFDNANTNTIGGTGAGSGNVIAGSATAGIQLKGSGLPGARTPVTNGRRIVGNPLILGGDVQLNVIAGNYIGVAADGVTALANTTGVEFNSYAKDNDLGAVGAGNVISGNGTAVVLTGSTTSGNRVLANFIGVGADGTTPVPNTTGSILITGSSLNTIGGSTGEGNTIANNAGSGVSIVGASGNAIVGNSVYSNGASGIDLNANGPDAQDDLAGDADANANGTQNYGVLSAATINGSNLDTVVSFNSSATSANSVLVQLFEADALGSGKTLLGSACIAGNQLANGSISVPIGGVVAGDPIVTTATSYTDGVCTPASIGDGTSEFSPSFLAAACTPPPATITTAAAACASSTGNSATVPATAGASYVWSILNGTIDSGQGTNAISFTAGASGSVTLSVTVTSSLGCVGSGSQVVTINPIPPSTISAPTTSCPNVSGLTASVPVTSGATYAWTITNGSITGGSGTDTITFTAGATGTTTLNVTVTANSCSSSDTKTISIAPAPTATISAPSSADPETSLSASVPTQAGASYSWTITNGTIDSGNGTPAINFTTGASGTTKVEVTVTLGSCSSSDAKLISIIDPTPLEADLSIAKTAASSVATSGTLTYSIGVTNHGPSDAAHVTITDPLPAGTTLQSVSGGSWTCTSFVTGVQCTGAVVAGATKSLTITVTAPAQSGTITNIATLASSIDTTPNNNSASASTSVTSSGNCNDHETPQLTAPAAGATLGSPVTLSWTAVPGAIGYRVWVEADGLPAQDLGTTTELSMTVVPGFGPIVAYVDALFADCPATRSTSVAFTVTTLTGCERRTTATPLAPSNGEVLGSSQVSFEWSAANDPDGYRLWIAINGATPSVLGTTVDETTFDAIIPAGSIEWWVESLYDGCASTMSEHSRFNLPAGEVCTTDVPQPIAPADGSTTTYGEVNFSWSPVSGALAYELWLSVEHGTPTLMGTTTATTFNAIVPDGALEWFVRAILDRCPQRDSATFHFTYDAPEPCLAMVRPNGINPLPRARTISPVDFWWTAVENASSYDLYVRRGNQEPQLVQSITTNHAPQVPLSNGNMQWFVRAHVPGCAPIEMSERKSEIVPVPAACSTLETPQIAAIGQVSSGVPFLIQWTPSPGATAYELQVASDSTFTGAETFTTSEPQYEVLRTNLGQSATPIYARVRPIDSRCQPVPTVGNYGLTAAIYVLPLEGVEGSAPANGHDVTHNIELGPELAGQSFLATVKEPWLSVAPASGVVAAGGTTLVVTADVGSLPVGTTLGSVTVTLSAPATARAVASNGTTFNFSTITVGKVTPVTPTPKSTPPPDALIIPAVAHSSGINAKFQSDVRLTNSSARPMQYLLTFTPSGDSGIATGRQTTFSVDPGRTVALDDVLRSWFGTGDESVTGTLEIRPQTQTATSTSSAALSGLANLFTFASSRTFNTTPNGSFGQYIPAVPFANFIGRGVAGSGANVLSLQQIAQSDRYRTNLGLVEGSGEPASLLVKVFGRDGQKMTEFPVQLAGGQHLQLNSFLTSNGVSSLDDGRVEVSVLSAGGKVTAYASVLDNATSDPLLVTPVTLSETGNTKWVVPGVADLQNSVANWQTDMRLFNAGTEDVDADLSFISQNSVAPTVRRIRIRGGQVLQFDKTLPTLFGVSNDGGAVHISTSAPARLIATARTYNQTTRGTYGQFISAVTPDEAAALNTRPLQILQVEESERFRSNVGIAEVSGNAAMLEIAVVPPDAKFTAVTQMILQPNEFRQLNSLLRSVGLADTYNARVSVRVIGGTGRVTAYASVIDMATNDPTYVPAQ